MLNLISTCSDLLMKNVGGINKYSGGSILFKRQATIFDLKTESKLNKVKSRRKTDLSTQGTFYGRKHDIRIGTAINSPSGLNLEIVNSEGRLTDTSIEKFAMTQMMGDNQRLTHKNQLTNALKRMDTYENSVSLLFVLLLEYNTKINIEKNDIKTKNVIKTGKQLRDIYTEEILNDISKTSNNQDDTLDEKLKNIIFTKFVESEKVGGQYIYDDVYHDTIIKKIIENIKNKKDDEKVSIIYKYWYVNKYNDGHNIIDSSRYERAGFVNRKFVINTRDSIYIANGVRTFDEFIKITDSNDLERFNLQENKIRCDTFSPKEFLILTTLLQGRERTTPFLSDQTVKLENIDNCYFYGDIDANSNMQNYAANVKNITVTSEDIRRVIQKYVTLHRVYDDLYAAQKLVMNYIVQPDCDTLESHYWFNMEFETILPKFRVFRGVHSYFTSGLPVRLNRLSMEFWDMYKFHWDTLFNVSMVENTLWFQSEFISNINSTDDEYLQYTITDPVYIKRDRTSHIASCISAITGMSEITNMFEHTGTLIKNKGESIFHNLNIFVDTIEGVKKLEYMNNTVELDQSHDYYVMHTLVPVSPSGEIFVIGLNGSLLDNTPYKDSFHLIKNEKHKVRSRFVTYYSYLDLWKWAVISRFTGYDVRYTIGSDQTRKEPLICYSANNVQLAKPPIHDVVSERYYKYVMEDITERTKIFGENPYYSMMYGETREMTWFTGEVRLMEDTSWNSFESLDLRSINQMTDVIYTDFRMDVKYIAKVKATFKDIQRDFEKQLMYLGQSEIVEKEVTIEPQQEQLILEEEQILGQEVPQDD